MSQPKGIITIWEWILNCECKLTPMLWITLCAHIKEFRQNGSGNEPHQSPKISLFPAFFPAILYFWAVCSVAHSKFLHYWDVCYDQADKLMQLFCHNTLAIDYLIAKDKCSVSYS